MLGNIEGSRKERRLNQSHHTAWVEKKYQQHWCLPPRWYEQPEREGRQVGPGSVWQCPKCDIRWTSFGIWLDNDPDNWPRGDMTTRPLYAVGRWRVIGEDREEALNLLTPKFRKDSLKSQWQLANDHLETQEDSYDWRGIALLSNKFLRRLIDLQSGEEGSWRDILD